MAMPSRKRLAVWILLGFLITFFAAIILYLAPLLFGDIEYDAQGNPVRNVSLFPFGNSTDPGSPIDEIIDPTDPETNTDPGTVNNNLDRQDQFRLIDAGPVIGAVMFNAPGHDDDIVGLAPATSTDKDVENTFRYIRLGTGHVFEGSTDSGEINRISNTTIPRIAEAQFVSPNRIIMRYPDDSSRIKTFSAELVRNFIGDNGTPFKLQGIFLQDDILDIDISNNNNLLQLVSKRDGVNRAAVLVTDEIGGNPRQVLASPFSEWLVSWSNSEPTALLQSRPSYNTFAGAYTLDTQTGAFAPYIDARKALGVLPTDNFERALVSENANGATKLYMWNRSENQYIDLGLSTFVEKCVWAEQRQRFYCAVPIGTIAEAEPDLWFQGVTQYSDQIWEIEPITGQSQIVLLPLQYTQDSLDMVDLLISPDGQFLYLRDKVKRSLWSYHIDYNIVGSVTPELSRTPSRPQGNSIINTETETETEVEVVATPTETFFE